MRIPLWFCIAVLLSTIAQAYAPTELYGRVEHEDRTGVAGIEVVASYTSEIGAEQVATTTIAYNTELRDNLVGYYFFNKGEIGAAPGTLVRVSAGGFNGSIESRPGTEMRQVPTITIPTQLEQDLGEFRGAIERHITVPQSVIVPRLPKSPGYTIIYGVVVDDAGYGVGNAPVSAQWETYLNQSTSATTTTSSGNGTEGYFEIGGIDAAPGRPIRVEGPRINETLEAKPGERVRVNQTVTAHAEEEELPPVHRAEQSEVSTAVPVAPGQDYGRLVRYLLYLFFLALLALLLFFARIYWLRHAHEASGNLHARIKRLRGSKPEPTPRAECVLCESSDTAAAATTKMVGERSDHCVVLHNGKYAGIIFIEDLLKRHGSDLGSMKAGEIARRVRPLEKNESYDALVRSMLDREERILPLVKGEKLAGIITTRMLLEELDRFFSRNDVDSMPRLEGGLATAVQCKPEHLLQEALEKMADEHAATAYVTRSRMSDGKEVVELIGVLEEGTLLEEVLNYRSLLGKMEVERLMIREIKGLPPGVTLLEGARQLLDRRKRSLPVLRGQEILGVATERGILQELYRFLQRLSKERRLLTRKA